MLPFSSVHNERQHQKQCTTKKGYIHNVFLCVIKVHIIHHNCDLVVCDVSAMCATCVFECQSVVNSHKCEHAAGVTMGFVKGSQVRFNF